MPFDFTTSEECVFCGADNRFTVQATLKDKVITPIENFKCDFCGTVHHFSEVEQDWRLLYGPPDVRREIDQ